MTKKATLFTEMRSEINGGKTFVIITLVNNNSGAMEDITILADDIEQRIQHIDTEYDDNLVRHKANFISIKEDVI